jgi:hypothetical protein
MFLGEKERDLMRIILTLATVVALGLGVAAQAAVVGAPSPLAEGSPDGWSGVTVMNGYGGLPSGELVSTVNFYASAGRADGNHNFQPLIAKQEGDAITIWDVGPVSTPNAGGEHSVTWGSKLIPADGNTYHPAFWQWNTGVDDTDGGMVAFGGDGGSGMFQQNRDGTSYVPAIGDDLLSGEQHASGAGGRAYQMNFTTVVPEPTTVVLAAVGLLPVLLGLRRRRR